MNDLEKDPYECKNIYKAKNNDKPVIIIKDLSDPYDCNNISCYIQKDKD